MDERTVKNRLQPIVWSDHISIVFELPKHEHFVLGHVGIVVPLLILAELDAHVVLAPGHKAVEVLRNNLVHRDGVRVADSQRRPLYRTSHWQHRPPEVDDAEALAGAILELLAPLLVAARLWVRWILDEHR